MVKSIGFRYLKEEDRQLFRILSIGRESTSDVGYFWEGNGRQGGGVIFQYTLSGEGRLRIGEQTHRIRSGQGFLVEVPSDHSYYYDPAAGEPWEFLWLRFSGLGMEDFCKAVLNNSKSPVLMMKQTSSPIVLLEKLCADMLNERVIDDKYLISLRVYEWMMSILRHSERGSEEIRSNIPTAFRNAAMYMEKHYATSIQLDEVAAFARMSKHHLCRTFPRYYGLTPVHYLRRKRIQEALRLLRDTELLAQEIAVRTGFDNLGYFGKVFRALVGMSPTEYRGKRNDLHVDSITLLD